MKKHKLFAALAALALVFAGCQTDSDSHEHSFSSDWSSDATNHWHAATCEHTEEVSEKLPTHSVIMFQTTMLQRNRTELKQENVLYVDTKIQLLMQEVKLKQLQLQHSVLNPVK